MKSVFDSSAYLEISERAEKLSQDIHPIWGKMNAAQMLAHLAATLEYACGNLQGKQIFLGKIIGRFMKSSFYDDSPMQKNAPTSPRFLMNYDKDFEKEKQHFLSVLKQFHEGGPAKVTNSPHMFFGPMTPEQWGMGMYKHIDHHLNQFGI